MYREQEYTVTDDTVNYVPVFNTTAANVTVVDRNGIGVRLASTFGNTTRDVFVYNWFAIVTNFTLASGEYFIETVNYGNDERTVKIGPTVTAGRVYAISDGVEIVSYTAQTGDTVTDVRDGIKAAVDTGNWGYTINTANISSDRFTMDMDDDQPRTFSYKIGKPKYKAGITIDTGYFIFGEEQSEITYPTITIPASFPYTSMTFLPGNNLEAYLHEPNLFGYTLNPTAGAGAVELTEVPGLTNPSTCVIDESQQRVYFDSNMALGAKIKIFQK